MIMWEQAGRYKKACIGPLFAYVDDPLARTIQDHHHQSLQWFIAPDDEDKNYRRALIDGVANTFEEAEARIREAIKRLADELLAGLEA
jgi:hypothetical protein